MIRIVFLEMIMCQKFLYSRFLTLSQAGFFGVLKGGGGGGFLARRDENAYKSSVTCSNHLKLGPCNH